MSCMKRLFAWKGKRGFGFASTAEEVSDGIDLEGRTAIVTGGASGIGAETARVLALRGARVIIAAMNVMAAESVKEEIKKSIPDGAVECMELDLSSLASVKKFADAFLATGYPLNLLINNADIMMCPFQRSADGIELQFATNYVGHFYLTKLLLEKLKLTAMATGIEGRIVNVSSKAHYVAYKEGIKFGTLNETYKYDTIGAYGQSKLANVLHANELARRLKEEGANVTANSVHPGFIKENFVRHDGRGTEFFRWLTFFRWKNIPQVGAGGASTTVYVALHPSLKGVSRKYFANCKEKVPSLLAQDTYRAKFLWDFTEKLINQKLPSH